MQGETKGETVAGDGPGTVTWMSYVELGRLRGTSAASAKRFANRKRWRKQPGNDGTVRVAVPPGGTVPRETNRAEPDGTVPGDQGRDHGRDRDRDRGVLPRALAALEDTVAGLRKDLSEANGRADAALALGDQLGTQLANAGERADRAEARAEELRRDLDAARVIAGAAQHAAQEAQEAANALRRSDEARKARSRLRRAWDGWRGR